MVFVAPAYCVMGLVGVVPEPYSGGAGFRGERRRKSITPTGVTQPTGFLRHLSEARRLRR